MEKSITFNAVVLTLREATTLPDKSNNVITAALEEVPKLNVTTSLLGFGETETFAIALSFKPTPLPAQE
jgi:hypothetical protein